MPLARRSFLAGGAAALLVARPAAAQDLPPDAPSPQAVFHDPDTPVFGNPRGDVSVVEFFDYQCPWCKKTWPMVQEEVARDGHVRLLLKDWPVFGPPSLYATKLTLGAGRRGAYAKAHAALMATKGALTNGRIDALLRQAGVDPKQAMADYMAEEDRWIPYLRRNYAEAEGFGFTGTPSYAIGYTIYPGVLDRAAFRAAIAKARQKA